MARRRPADIGKRINAESEIRWRANRKIACADFHRNDRVPRRSPRRVSRRLDGVFSGKPRGGGIVRLAGDDKSRRNLESASGRARLLPCQKSFLFRVSQSSRAREGRRSESSGASPPPRHRDTRDASRAGKRASEKDGGDEIDKKRDIVNALLTVLLALSGKQLGRKARKEERRSRTLRALSKMHSNTPIESRACSPIT